MSTHEQLRAHVAERLHAADHVAPLGLVDPAYYFSLTNAMLEAVATEIETLYGAAAWLPTRDVLELLRGYIPTQAEVEAKAAAMYGTDWKTPLVRAKGRLDTEIAERLDSARAALRDEQ